eukprot:1997828-Pyramimonas_sp.AAC.1
MEWLVTRGGGEPFGALTLVLIVRYRCIGFRIFKGPPQILLLGSITGGRFPPKTVADVSEPRCQHV